MVLVLDPTWARFAPLTGWCSSPACSAWAAQGLTVDAQTADLSLLTLVPVLLVGLAVSISAATWSPTGASPATQPRRQIRAGTSPPARSASVDAERLAGVSVGEPLGLRLPPQRRS